MITFLKELNKEFKKLCPQSYLEENTSKDIIFPYLTYSLSGEDLEFQEGFYIDIDVFYNCGANTINLEVLTDNIKKHFRRNIILKDDILLQIDYRTSRNVPTLDEMIKRRYVQLYCKVDWRR